ncbi:uncharacterized protein KZ484_015160 [Pholidichthys leucotaenia]
MEEFYRIFMGANREDRGKEKPPGVAVTHLNDIAREPAVTEVGNNLHFILPEGAFLIPTTSSSSSVNPLLTAISQNGSCERLHSWNKHVPKVLDTFGASYKSSMEDCTGIQKPHATGRALVNGLARNDQLHELEWLNKEIETVKHEVEQEQRRLSHYQTVYAETIKKTPVCKCDKDKNVDGQEPSRKDSTKAHTQVRKYVVDNSKPRTDLEYDPLSNFSADMQSFSSSGKEHKIKHRQKNSRNSVPCDQKDPAACRGQPSQSSLDDSVDDSSEDGELVIDVSPSPDEQRWEKPDDFVAKELPQHTRLEEKGTKMVPVLLDSEPVQCENRNAFQSGKSRDKSASRNELCENVQSDGAIATSSESFKDLQSECQEITGFLSDEMVVKNPEPVNIPASTGWQHQSRGEEVEKMSQTRNSCFHKAPASDFPRRESSDTLVPDGQKMLSNAPGHMQSKSTINHRSSVKQELEPLSSDHQYPALTTSDNSQLEAELSDPTVQLLKETQNANAIIMDSTSEQEEELSCSDIELSDSDPMEECYRIFMEANSEDGGKEKPPGVPTTAVDVEKLEVKVTPQSHPERKRVAHEAKHAEQPMAKSRPQPQVLVPFRGPTASGVSSHTSVASKIQQAQQRASILTASVKGGQAFVSSTCHKQPGTQSTTSALIQAPETPQPTSVQNAHLNCIPRGPAVTEVGNNLHFILPEGAFLIPATSGSSSVPPLLIPMNQIHRNTQAPKQIMHPYALTPVQRFRATTPVLIPAPACKASQTTVFPPALSQSSSATSTNPQNAVQAAAKQMPAKHKLKQQYKPSSDKVPHNVRQHYINMYTEEFLKMTLNVHDAFEKALAEEKIVYNRSVNKLRYNCNAVNALKRLKNQSTVAAKDDKAGNSQARKGNISLNPKKLKRTANDMVLYENLEDYILTDEKLIESNYPVQHPEKRGSAVLFADDKNVHTDPLKRICCRCGATYFVNQTGKHIRKEECTYHYGKGVEKRVPGGVETSYSCCQQIMGAPGCQVFKLHVHDSLSMDGFVSTVPRRPLDTSCPGVYSLDCEMCYTIHGLELSRVTVVNSSLEVIYDTFVKPSNVIDYNTRFSGICEDDVNGNNTSLKEVQETLLSFISADTILIGHSLETDLCLLKLLHGVVVDTSVVFPHHLGPPHKLTLNNLAAEYLRRIIQESVCGHDTAENAAACMELMLWRVKQDRKSKKKQM